MFRFRNRPEAASNSLARTVSFDTYASALRRNAAALCGEATDSAFSMLRTWRIAFLGLTQVCGLIPPWLPSPARTGGTPSAVSTIRMRGLDFRTGAPRNSSIPYPLAVKRSAAAIFRISPRVSAELGGEAREGGG